MSIYKKKRKDGTFAWYYDFAYRGRRYRGVGGTTKTQALRVLDKIRNEVFSGEYGIKRIVATKRIEEFSKTYLQRRQYLKSRERDELSNRTLLKFFSGKKLDKIFPSDVEDYIAKRKEDGVANATINRELACLKRMYNLAIKWNEAKTNPVKEVEFLREPPGRTRFLSAEEANKLLKSCNDNLRSIVFTALNTGMRLSEILHLKWNQVHIDTVIDPYVEINQSKNNKNRFIPLNEDMILLFENLKQIHPEFVFIGKRGQPLISIRTIFEKALKKAGILNFRFHDLRHTFASHFVMQGGDLLTLKEILGHSSMKMVERYAHLAQAHKRRQVNNLGGLFTKNATYMPPERKWQILQG